jgi:predicted HTH transcriptional regulator
MYRHHALSAGWEAQTYGEFLKARRKLMAQTIQEAFMALAGPTPTTLKPLSIEELVRVGEGDSIEFKSTLRTNLHTGERDSKMEFVVLKTIAGFLNKDGGTLAIGVADDGTPIGIEKDGFPNEDKMALHLVNLLKERLGGEHAIHVLPRFREYQGARVLTVECTRSKTPVFVKDGQSERFFVRYGPSTQELAGATAQTYIRIRFV